MYEHVYTSMATKTISITREAYDRLKARKGPEEGFSDAILRLTDRRPLLDTRKARVPRLLLHRHELGHLRRGPRILERPLEHGEAPVRDDGDLVRHLIQEAAVVAHDEQHARVRPQGRRHDLLALDVEVVRRLVEDQQVVVLGDELREGEARPLSAAELADAAVDRVPPEPEAAEEAPGPGLRRGRSPHAADLLEEGAGGGGLLRLLGG